MAPLSQTFKRGPSLSAGLPKIVFMRLQGFDRAPLLKTQGRTMCGQKEAEDGPNGGREDSTAGTSEGATLSLVHVFPIFPLTCLYEGRKPGQPASQPSGWTWNDPDNQHTAIEGLKTECNPILPPTHRTVGSHMTRHGDKSTQEADLYALIPSNSTS